MNSPKIRAVGRQNYVLQSEFDMSKKTKDATSHSDMPSGNFELSNTSKASHPQYNSEGFAFWMLNPVHWLPNSSGGFIRFFIFIIVLAIGSIVHIYLSSQILGAQLTQWELEQEYQAIQRQNAQIAWQIAEYTSLDQIRQRATNIGYTGLLGRSYAVSPISDDTLALLGVTILGVDSQKTGASETSSPEANSPELGKAEDKRLLAHSQPSGNQESQGNRLGQDTVLAANVSANRLIENGLLEAIKVIDGR